MANFFSPLVENSIRLASYWHKSQLTSDGVFDYITHPYAVGMILNCAGFADEVVAAGLCHKLLSETECPSKEIVDATSARILLIIEPISHKKFGRERSWISEKSLFLKEVKDLSWESKAVYIADRIHSLHSLMESLNENGLELFDQLIYSAENSLWFEDQLCMIIQDSWSHELIDHYDELVNQYVDLLESLDKNKTKNAKLPEDKLDAYDFEKPVIEQIEIVESETEKRDSSYSSERNLIPKVDPLILEKIASIDEYIHDKKEKIVALKPDIDIPKEDHIDDDGIYFKHLDKKEALVILPAALKLSIKEKKISSQLFQDKLDLNFMVSYRVLKELKRVHVIKQVDGIKPRKVNIETAKEMLNNLKDYSKKK